VAGRSAEVVMLEIAALFVHPVKSLRAVPVQRAEITARGFRDDRAFVVVDARGRFVSQREVPRMALVRAEMREDTLTLSADGAGSLVVRPDEGGPRRSVTIWDDTCEAVSAGAEAAAWLSEVLSRRVELMKMPSSTERPVDPRYARATDRVGFADGFPYLVATEGSLESVRERTGLALPMTRFRPNLMIRGAAPFDEDRWKVLRIGTHVFRLVKPCSRCTIVDIDPETAEKHGDVLRTLSGFRKVDSKVMFGINALSDSTSGSVAVGDPITVLE
jgi:uncharacterized protein